MMARLYSFEESLNACKAARTMGLAGHGGEPVHVGFFNSVNPDYHALDDCARDEMTHRPFRGGQKGSVQRDKLHLLMRFLPEAKRPQEAIGWLKERLLAAIRVLEDHLTGRARMVGATPSLADFACCGYPCCPETFGFNRTEFPDLDRWQDGMTALPGWKHPHDLMPGTPSDRA